MEGVSDGIREMVQELASSLADQLIAEDAEASDQLLEDFSKQAVDELADWHLRLSEADSEKLRAERARNDLSRMRETYMKEVQGLRQQLFKKEKAQKNGEEFSADCISLFNPSEFVGADRETKQLLKEQAAGLQKQFEEQMGHLRERNSELHSKLQSKHMQVGLQDKFLHTKVAEVEGEAAARLAEAKELADFHMDAFRALEAEQTSSSMLAVEAFRALEAEQAGIPIIAIIAAEPALPEVADSSEVDLAFSDEDEGAGTALSSVGVLGTVDAVSKQSSPRIQIRTGSSRSIQHSGTMGGTAPQVSSLKAARGKTHERRHSHASISSEHAESSALSTDSAMLVPMPMVTTECVSVQTELDSALLQQAAEMLQHRTENAWLGLLGKEAELDGEQLDRKDWEKLPRSKSWSQGDKHRQTVVRQVDTRVFKDSSLVAGKGAFDGIPKETFAVSSHDPPPLAYLGEGLSESQQPRAPTSARATGNQRRRSSFLSDSRSSSGLCRIKTASISVQVDPEMIDEEEHKQQEVARKAAIAAGLALGQIGGGTLFAMLSRHGVAGTGSRGPSRGASPSPGARLHSVVGSASSRGSSRGDTPSLGVSRLPHSRGSSPNPGGHLAAAAKAAAAVADSIAPDNFELSVQPPQLTRLLSGSFDGTPASSVSEHDSEDVYDPGRSETIKSIPTVMVSSSADSVSIYSPASPTVKGLPGRSEGSAAPRRLGSRIGDELMSQVRSVSSPRSQIKRGSSGSSIPPDTQHHGLVLPALHVVQVGDMSDAFAPTHVASRRLSAPSVTANPHPHKVVSRSPSGTHVHTHSLGITDDAAVTMRISSNAGSTSVSPRAKTTTSFSRYSSN
ncbi:unnamed protein product [Polarella glacialis]|uniref:Uncharacterized protein n=1 Tax=Polarella glacialis TaxID=89957 RepID=A0A813K794_POLGL|nr:unnamed protein product [Polarella glacialis]